MKNTGRIYVVNDGTNKYLVDAHTAAQAVGHVVRERYRCHVAGTRDVAELIAAGVKVEKAYTATGDGTST